MNRLLLIFCLLLSVGELSAQGFYFGVKGGATIGTQNWNGFERDPLWKYHGIAFIESISENQPFALFLQAGFHQKGSAIRNRNFQDPFNPGQVIRPPAFEFIFHNISLTLGAKQKFDFTGSTKAYYLLGIRGDYTVDTNLDVYNSFIERNPAYAFFPIDEDFFIQEFNYGVTFGGGLEFNFTEFIGGLLEFTVNPDLSTQYRQPEIPNVRDPNTGNTRTIPERNIKNITFEITLGLRFLRKVEYID